LKKSKKLLKNFNNRYLSEILFEMAKKGVETVIEKNEEETEKWINGELEKLEKK